MGQGVSLTKEVKPEIVEGKTWQDLKETMTKMIKDGKVVPPAERFEQDVKEQEKAKNVKSSNI